MYKENIHDNACNPYRRRLKQSWDDKTFHFIDCLFQSNVCIDSKNREMSSGDPWEVLTRNNSFVDKLRPK